MYSVSFYIMYLDSIQHRAGLLQRHCSPCLKGFCRVGDLHQPPAQLLHHFSVALPLANQTVDDAPPLLSTPHYALPLVTQQSQLQVELVSAEGRGDVISRKTFISTKTNGFTSLVMFIYLVL